MRGEFLIPWYGEAMTVYDKIDNGNTRVAGVGSALVDILIHEDDMFVKKAGTPKGGMTYVEKSAIDETVASASQGPIVVPGGSACNTMVGIGRLGGQARFVGKCGNDNMGRLFRDDLKEQNPGMFIRGRGTFCPCTADRLRG